KDRSPNRSRFARRWNGRSRSSKKKNDRPWSTCTCRWCEADLGQFQSFQMFQSFKPVKPAKMIFRRPCVVFRRYEMAHFKSTVAVIISAACLFLTPAGYGQSKPLKKIRVGVPSVGMGNII